MHELWKHCHIRCFVLNCNIYWYCSLLRSDIYSNPGKYNIGLGTMHRMRDLWSSVLARSFVRHIVTSWRRLRVDSHYTTWQNIVVWYLHARINSNWSMAASAKVSFELNDPCSFRTGGESTLLGLRINCIHLSEKFIRPSFPFSGTRHYRRSKLTI